MPPSMHRMDRQVRTASAVSLVLAVTAAGSALVTPALWALFGSMFLMGGVGVGLARLRLPGLAAFAATVGAALYPWYGIATPAPTTSVVTEIGWLTLSMCMAAATFRPGPFVGWWCVHAAGFALLVRSVGIPPGPQASLAALMALLGVVGVVFTVQRARMADALEERERSLEEARRAALAREGETRHRLEGAQGQLVASARAVALGELAASVAHQLNNPLTAVILAVRELERLPDPQIEEPLEQVRDATEACRSVLQRLMRHADRGLGTPEDVDLECVVRDTVDLVRRHLELQGTDVRVEVAGPLPIRVRIEHVREVLLTLLMRVAPGQPVPEVRLRAWADEAQAWLQFEWPQDAPPASDVALLIVESLLQREDGHLVDRQPDRLSLSLPLAEAS